MKITLLIISLFATVMWAQSSTKTNLDVVNSLVEESIKSSIDGLPFEDIAYYINFNSAPEYNLMSNRAEIALGKLVTVTDNKAKALYNLSYTIEEIRTSYINPEKDGLFGSYNLTREISLKGTFVVGSLGSLIRSDDFEQTYSDTVEFDSVKDLETMSLPFTRGKKPDEPFFSSLLEPAIALGAIAITIVLFFTVRSN
jgi:hypothetical protein